ncbi:hypothetical protein OHA21_30490 [Actinoplanes sp. NBC_00393]|uniref:hypothetical protein n=1 Tax=Actinoplanes sp. NBC_00393 TaxID=2975953 RepID=UPI002E24F452
MTRPEPAVPGHAAPADAARAASAHAAPSRAAHAASAHAAPSHAVLAQAALAHAEQRGGEAMNRLVAHLAGLALDDPAAQTAALSALGSRPRLLVRLDEYIRRDWAWRSAGGAANGPDEFLRRLLQTAEHGQGSVVDRGLGPAVECGSGRAAERGPGPLAVALAAAHRDGRVREAAVLVMAEQGRIEQLPFLVLRCDDWVVRVRRAARAAVAALLRERPEEAVPAALPMVTYLAGRQRSGTLVRLVDEVVEEHLDRMIPVLLATHDPRSRRLAFAAGERLARWTYSDLVGFALREPDPVVRLKAAEAACRAAVEQGDADTLRSLAAARFSAVRALALVGLAQLGYDAEVAAALEDPSPLIRAYARSRATDALALYRAAVATRPNPEAVAGLGEVGGYRDAELLTPLLGQAGHRLRAAAVRALVALDAVPIEEVTSLLTDPAAAVVREASLALRPYRRRLPPELLWRLLADANPAVRLGGYRLLAVRGPAIRLAAALVLTADGEPTLAARGRAEVLRLSALRPEESLRPEEGLPAGLEELLERARQGLGDRYEDVRDRLRDRAKRFAAGGRDGMF